MYCLYLLLLAVWQNKYKHMKEGEAEENIYSLIKVGWAETRQNMEGLLQLRKTEMINEHKEETKFL